MLYVAPSIEWFDAGFPSRFDESASFEFLFIVPSDEFPKLHFSIFCRPDEIGQKVNLLVGISERCEYEMFHLISQLLYDACSIDNDFFIEARSQIFHRVGRADTRYFS